MQCPHRRSGAASARVLPRPCRASRICLTGSNQRPNEECHGNEVAILPSIKREACRRNHEQPASCRILTAGRTRRAGTPSVLTYVQPGTGHQSGRRCREFQTDRPSAIPVAAVRNPTSHKPKPNKCLAITTGRPHARMSPSLLPPRGRSATWRQRPGARTKPPQLLSRTTEVPLVDLPKLNSSPCRRRLAHAAGLAAAAPARDPGQLASYLHSAPKPR